MVNFEYQENIETYLKQKIEQYHDFKKQNIDYYILRKIRFELKSYFLNIHYILSLIYLSL